MREQSTRKRPRQGLGQLTLVEHALCPLDHRASLVENLVHASEYQFTGANRQRRTARARVFSPHGLSANDELYLWGLLALTMAQPELDAELRATPHWCLRQLGIIDQHSRRGGRQYRQFADAIRRISVVSYLNDAFYDPVRAEHRQVSFGFLSYSLPQSPESCRAWQIVWDPIFFELVRAAAGQFRFDLDHYRQFDPASRRLFLFACKVFSRRRNLPLWELRHLAIDLLGFSSTLAVPDMKVKVGKCVERLRVFGVVDKAEFLKIRAGHYRVRLTRGSYFDKCPRTGHAVPTEESPLWEILQQIGFQPGAANRVIRQFPRRHLEEWADITLAAIERFGHGYFRKSPMAFLVDGVKNAARGTRTAPDWWHQIRKQEAVSRELNQESRKVFDRVRNELFGTREATEPGERKRRKLVRAGSLIKPIH